MLYNIGYLPEELPQPEIVGFEIYPNETINLQSTHLENNDQHKGEIMTSNHTTMKSNTASENKASILYGNYVYLKHTLQNYIIILTLTVTSLLCNATKE